MVANRNRDRRGMDFEDWVHAAASMLLGLFLGSLANALIQQATTDWPFALFMTGLFAVLFFIMSMINKPFDWLFSMVTRSSRDPQDKGRKPLLLVFSLPAGFVLGVVLARVGVDVALLGVIL